MYTIKLILYYATVAAAIELYTEKIAVIIWQKKEVCITTE